MEEKQKEAINLYVNFVSLLNSQRDIIINKINIEINKIQLINNFYIFSKN